MIKELRQQYILSPSLKELTLSLIKNGVIALAIAYIIAYLIVVVGGVSIYWFTEPISSFSKLNIAFLFLVTAYMALAYAIIFYRIAYDAIHKRKKLHKDNKQTI